MSGFFGKSNFGGNNKQRKYFKLKDGEQVYRILPAMGELAESGRWSAFHSVHYGYKNTEGKQKPFLSCEVKNRKNGMIEVADAAKDRITTLKAKYEEAKKTGNKAVLEKLEPLAGPTGIYNLDNNHYMNAIDAQGNIGVLKLRHKAKLALEAEIKKLNADGTDPLSPSSGRFFVFTRSGMGRDTTFSVSVLKEKLKVEGVGVVERDVVHTLDDDIANRCGKQNADGSFVYKEAAQLETLFKVLTSSEVASIVESSDLMTGISPALDRFFGKTQAAAQVMEDDSVDAEEMETAIQVAPVTAAAAPAAKAHTAAKPVITPKTQAPAITEMSNEDFLKSLSEGTL
jgi:hypothetical protein